jgi:hypothetical protein
VLFALFAYDNKKQLCSLLIIWWKWFNHALHEVDLHRDTAYGNHALLFVGFHYYAYMPYAYIHLYILYYIRALLFTMQFSVRFYEFFQVIFGKSCIRYFASSIRFLLFLLQEKRSNAPIMNYLHSTPRVLTTLDVGEENTDVSHCRCTMTQSAHTSQGKWSADSFLFRFWRVWRWCILLRITGVLNFIHRPVL